MNNIERVFHWFEKHPSLGIEVIRIYLGVGLFIKGVVFHASPEMINTYFKLWEQEFVVFILIHYVILAHIGGGLLLSFGLLTRISAIIQIPILCGAVFMIHSTEGLFSTGQSLEFSSLVLLLLVLVFLHGPGAT